MSVSEKPVDPAGVFFWARSGGGHRTAKEGIKQQKIKEYQAQGKTLDTTQDIDITGKKVLSSVTLPFVGGLGDIGVNAWDEAQRKGDLKFLENYASWGWVGEIIFYPLVYFRVKSLLQDMKAQPDFVVSTQAFCMKAMVHAMHTVNREKGWDMKMDVYLTDMPSKRAIHFFPSIRKVAESHSLRDMITLHAPPPLVKADQTPEDFWKKHCGDIKVITNEPFPIREAFLDTGNLKARLEQPVVDVKIKLNNPAEAAIIKKGIGHDVPSDDKEVTVKINQDDKLAFLMLGSQPTTKAVLEWLQTIAAESTKAAKSDHQNYFFLYCGAPVSDKNPVNPLWSAVSEEIDKLKQEKKLADNFNIVPFTNQSADEIALLMARSDMSITRSGGATAMELLQLSQAKELPQREGKLVLINSEAALGPAAQDPEELCKKVEADIAANLPPKLPQASSPEWESVKSEMLEYCRQQGCDRKTSKALVENVLKLYLYSDNASLPDLIKAMDEQASMLSRDTKTENEKIEAQMKKMEQKQKYQSLSSVAQRQLAIEKVLIKEGIVLWEAGNAKYLGEKLGAHVTNPLYARTLLREKFFA